MHDNGEQRFRRLTIKVCPVGASGVSPRRLRCDRSPCSAQRAAER